MRRWRCDSAPAAGGGAGVFWSGNCYMVMYSYTCAEVEHSELFFWRGRDVTPLNFLTWRFDLSQLLMQMPQVYRACACACARACARA